MSWFWLAVALAASVLYALTAPKPRGTRPIGRTRLMTVARVVLLLVVLLLFYRAFFHGL